MFTVVADLLQAERFKESAADELPMQIPIDNSIQLKSI
jgi:hypothetical protein